MKKQKISLTIDDSKLIRECATQILAQHHGEYDDEGNLIDDGNPHKRLDRVIRETVIAQIRKRLDETIEQVTKEHISAAITTILAEGWQKTDNYGEPRGPKMTLKDRIAEQLTSVRDNYNRKSWVEELLAARVEAVFKAEFQKPIEEAKAQFRALLDGQIAGAVQNALKSALGLR